MNENTFVPNHFGGSHDVPKTDDDAAAANSFRPASASCTLHNRTTCTAKDDYSARISRVVASLSRGMSPADCAESGHLHPSHRDHEQDDDESGIVGATIVFTPEPSPSSSPKTNGSKKSHEDDPLDGLPTSASPPIPPLPLPHSLAASNVTRNTGGSSNVSSHYIGTIPIHSMEDQTEANENNEEGKDKHYGGTDDSNSVDLKKCDGSITTEYEMLDGISTRASSKSVMIEDLEDDEEEEQTACPMIEQKTENETKQKVEQEIDDANQDFETEKKPPEPSSLFSSPTTAEINAFLRDMEHNNDGSSIPSTLPSLHAHGFESPATPTSCAPFKTPKQNTCSVVVLDSSNGHRSEVSSLHSSSVGEFSAMTRSMIRRIRKSIKGEDAKVDSPLEGGKQGVTNEEERIPSFQDLMNLWEWKTSFGEISYSMTGRTLFREDKTGKDDLLEVIGQGSGNAAGAASGKDLEDAEMKPSALFSGEVATPGQPSSGLLARKVARDTEPASFSTGDSANQDLRGKGSREDPSKQTSVRKSIINGSNLTLRELVGELLHVGVYFMLLLSLLALEIASPVIQAVKKRSIKCFGKFSRESTDAGLDQGGHIDENVSNSNELSTPANQTMAKSEGKIAVSSNVRHSESYNQEAKLSSRSNPSEVFEQISADNDKSSDTSNNLVVQRTTSNEVHSMNRAIGKWLFALAGLFLWLVILSSTIPSKELMEHLPHSHVETTPRTSYCPFTNTRSFSILQGFEFCFRSTQVYIADDATSKEIARASSQDELIQGSLDQRGQEFSQNIQEPSEDPIDESTNGHAEEPAQGLSEESLETSCEECISKRTERLIEEPLQEPGRKTIHGEPFKETVVASTDKPLEEPLNKRIQKQTEESVGDHFQGTEEIPITDVPTEDLTEARLKEPAQEILQAFSQESCEASTVEPILDSFGKEVDKITDEPIQDLVREPFKEAPTNETIEDHSEYHSTPPNYVGGYFNETASHIIHSYPIVVFHPEDAVNDNYYSALLLPGVIFTTVVSISIIIFCYYVASSKTNAKEHSSCLEPMTFNKGMWTNKENSQFFRGVNEHGTNWKKVAECIPTRTVHQVISKGRYWMKMGSPPEMKRSKRDVSSHSEASDTTPKIRNTVILGSIDVDDINLGERLSKFIIARSPTRTKGPSATC